MPFLQKQHKFSCVYTGVFPASCTPRPTKGDIAGDTVALNEDQNNVFMPPWHLAHTAPHIQTNTNNPLSPKSANYAPRGMLWEPKWLDTERHMTSPGPTLTRCKHPGGQSGHPSILPQKSEVRPKAQFYAHLYPFPCINTAKSVLAVFIQAWIFIPVSLYKHSQICFSCVYTGVDIYTRFPL